MEKTITKKMLTGLMNDRNTIRQKVNALISQKELQAHKGVQLDGIHKTSEGYWSAIRFPQWVKTENANGDKAYRFHCTEDGEFISW